MKTEIVKITTRDNRFLSGFLVLPAEKFGEEGNIIPWMRDTAVLLLHDLPGMKKGAADIFTEMQTALAKKGFRSLAFDFSGFGESAERPEHFGPEQICEDIEDVRLWLKDTVNVEDIAIIAEGLSAKIALDVCDTHVKSFVALYPLWQTGEGFSAHGVDLAQYKPSITNEEIEALARSLADELPSAESLKIKMPMTIHIGSDDHRVPVSQADWAKENINAPRLEVTVYEKGSYGLPQAGIRQMVLHHTAEFLSKLR
ncbi:MAG: alpha/beta fold hydrolase [Alphaproteobacteria bacterium]|nr:alpha/beta fold hydrolase [Alphaproteobacteria bacterium]